MKFEYIELRRIKIDDDSITILITKFRGKNMQTRARIFCLGRIKTLLPLLRTAEALKFGNDVNWF